MKELNPWWAGEGHTCSRLPAGPRGQTLRTHSPRRQLSPPPVSLAPFTGPKLKTTPQRLSPVQNPRLLKAYPVQGPLCSQKLSFLVH